MTLDKLPIGRSATVTKVGGEGALRYRLLDMGIIPRTKIRIVKTAPMGDPLQIHVRDYDLTLRKDDAAMIEVTEEENA